MVVAAATLSVAAAEVPGPLQEVEVVVAEFVAADGALTFVLLMTATAERLTSGPGRNCCSVSAARAIGSYIGPVASRTQAICSTSADIPPVAAPRMQHLLAVSAAEICACGRPADVAL